VDRLLTIVLALLAGTVFAVLSVQAQPVHNSSPPIVAVNLYAPITPRLATTTTVVAETTTTIAVIPAKVPLDKSKRCPQYEALFAKYNLPVQIFSYIAWRESRCNPNGINAKWDANGNMTYNLNSDKSWDSGLLQVNSSWISSVREVCAVNTGDKRRDLETLFDAECNVKFAKFIMDNTKGKLGNWNL